MRAQNIKESLQRWQAVKIQYGDEELRRELASLARVWGLREIDPTTLMSKLRYVTELLLRIICESRHIPLTESNLTVNNYLQKLGEAEKAKSLELPPWFRGTVETLRNYGNAGAHAGRGAWEEKDAAVAMGGLLQLLEWMRDDLGVLRLEPRERSWSLLGAVAMWPVSFLLGAGLAWGVGAWSAPTHQAEPQPAPASSPSSQQPAAASRVERDPAPEEVPPPQESTPPEEAPIAPAPIEAGRVSIPAGGFTRGSARGERRNQPERQIALSAFQIDRAEVTVREYALCVAAGRCELPADHTKIEMNWGKRGREDHPINGVSWDQARRFCQWRGGELPTEAQWERAARGAKDKRDLPWGDAPPSCQRAMMSGCPSPTPSALTSPVGAHPEGRSPDGLEDMAGNVWEWTLDYHDDGFYARSPARDPVARRAGNQVRVFRGGSFNRGGDDLSVWRRRGKSQDESDHGLGFRCAYQP